MAQWQVYRSAKGYLASGDITSGSAALYASASNAADLSLSELGEVTNPIEGTEVAATLSWVDDGGWRLDVATVTWFGPITDVAHVVVADTLTGKLLATVQPYEAPF